MTRDTIPCETCGKPTPYFGTKRCDNCWEVERRLDAYLVTPQALVFVRQFIPALDDWADSKPDAWDYEKVLTDNDVHVEWCDQLTSDGVTYEPAPSDLCGWGFYWQYGAIHIGRTSLVIARKAAALFVSLWLRGVSASFADKLMDGFITFLERQENPSLTFLGEVHYDGWLSFRLTREHFCKQVELGGILEHQIIKNLDPSSDEEIIVTFTKRKK